MKLLTIIPTKLDSTRLTEKNIRDLNGKPLFYHSIKIAKKIKEIKDIYVSTDSERIIKLSKKYGVGVIKRQQSNSSHSLWVTNWS